jgi:hypothetical protein
VLKSVGSVKPANETSTNNTTESSIKVMPRMTAKEFFKDLLLFILH